MSTSITGKGHLVLGNNVVTKINEPDPKHEFVLMIIDIRQEIEQLLEAPNNLIQLLTTRMQEKGYEVTTDNNDGSSVIIRKKDHTVGVMVERSKENPKKFWIDTATRQTNSSDEQR